MNIAIQFFKKNGLYNFKAVVVKRKKGKKKNEYFPFCQYLGVDKKKIITMGLQSVKKMLRKLKKND